jgi:hypothetical protein
MQGCDHWHILAVIRPVEIYPITDANYPAGLFSLPSKMMERPSTKILFKIV